MKKIMGCPLVLATFPCTHYSVDLKIRFSYPDQQLKSMARLRNTFQTSRKITVHEEYLERR